MAGPNAAVRVFAPLSYAVRELELKFENEQKKAEYYAGVAEEQKAIIKQILEGSGDVLYMHPYDAMQLFNRPGIVDIFVNKSEPYTNEFTIARTSIRVKQSPFIPEGVGLAELDRRERQLLTGKIEPSAAAKAEMVKALPMVLEILNDPGFVRRVVERGYQFDVKAFFEFLQSATQWRVDAKKKGLIS